MRLKIPPSKALLTFYIIGGSISACFLVAGWFALDQNQYEPIGFIGSMYIALWVIVGVFWKDLEIKKSLKTEEEKRRVIERERASEEFFRRLRSDSG